MSIVGDDFRGHGSLVVWFGEVPARMVVIESDRLVTLRSPPVDHPGAVEIKLEFADGVVIEVPSGFEYTPDRGIEIK